ncbi:unnamed protein product [Mytilus coruscus]|uniref:Selenoprotein P N-terminal domain-containing protein n=1 Tax=Mytilus coruscus TaxID=42192 RepID=A0A6J8BTM9_MYTCO|nr:unnamed protein product [Mytilus coruscus]
MSFWRASGKRQKCRFGAERVKRVVVNILLRINCNRHQLFAQEHFNIRRETMKSPGVLTGLLAAALLVSVSGRFCQYPPTWRTTSEVQPMLNTRGKHQAAGLETIRQEYIAQGRTEISFMIVNSKEVPEQIGQLSSRTNFPVYQDTNATNIWNKLNGGKDDVLIYDRCGKLVYFIPFPSSLLRYHLTDWAIRTAYDTDPCGCQRSIRRSRRRRRRHNHERHSHRSGSNAIVVGMGRSAKTHARDERRVITLADSDQTSRYVSDHKVPELDNVQQRALQVLDDDKTTNLEKRHDSEIIYLGTVCDNA